MRHYIAAVTAIISLLAVGAPAHANATSVRHGPSGTVSASSLAANVGQDQHGHANCLVSPCIYVADERGEFSANRPALDIYTLTANGNVSPSERLKGPRTKITAPHGVAVDSSRNVYVINSLGDRRRQGAGVITVYAAGQSATLRQSSALRAPIRA